MSQNFLNFEMCRADSWWLPSEVSYLIQYIVCMQGVPFHRQLYPALVALLRCLLRNTPVLIMPARNPVSGAPQPTLSSVNVIEYKSSCLWKIALNTSVELIFSCLLPCWPFSGASWGKHLYCQIATWCLVLLSMSLDTGLLERVFSLCLYNRLSDPVSTYVESRLCFFQKRAWSPT